MSGPSNTPTTRPRSTAAATQNPETKGDATTTPELKPASSGIVVGRTEMKELIECVINPPEGPGVISTKTTFPAADLRSIEFKQGEGGRSYLVEVTRLVSEREIGAPSVVDAVELKDGEVQYDLLESDQYGIDGQVDTASSLEGLKFDKGTTAEPGGNENQPFFQNKYQKVIGTVLERCRTLRKGL